MTTLIGLLWKLIDFILGGKLVYFVVGKLIGFIPWEKVFDFVRELAAVFFGVLAAFLFDKYRDRQVEHKEGNRVLNLIGGEIIANRGILEGMKYIEAPAVPNEGPMRGMWDGLTSKLGLVKNDNLLSEATVLYFFLANLDKMLDVYRQYTAKYQYADPTKKAQMESILADQCKYFKGYITKYILPKIDEVLTLIGNELS